jgi:prepilin-type N-terminal cleavage/methylation domain-containing protein
MKMQAAHFELHAQTPVLRYAEEPGLSRGRPGPSAYLRTGVLGHHAFTLIELMISIALVLLLILGVNQVFTYTTQAVGAGEAINSAIRYSRAAQGQFASDFSAIVPNGGNSNDAASIIIASRAYYAFRDAKDQAAEGDTSSSSGGYPVQAYLDLAGSGKFGDPAVNGDTVHPATYNFRNHRLDVLSFFARGLFPRQTGNPGTFVDNMTSQEAWIWYGHLHLPDNNGNDPVGDFPNNNTTSTFPCMGSSATNPNNCFGSKLVLGRVAMLLNYVNSGTMSDNSRNPQSYYATNQGSLMHPLWPGAVLAVDGAPTDPSNLSTQWCLPDARVDVADTSIAIFRQRIASNITNLTVPTWYNYMMDGNQLTSLTGNGHPNFGRFKCNPFIAKPMQSWNMAQASPYFLGGCSQFIVEYAGDFLTQDNDPSHTARVTSPLTSAHAQYGDVTGPGSDGQLDYVLTYPNGVNNPPVKQIQWYGMPRSTSGNSTINWANGDVVPLRDRFQTMYSATTGAQIFAPAGYQNIPCSNPAAAAALNYPIFEKAGPAYQSSTGDYKTSMTTADANTGYECAFGPTYQIPASPNPITVTDPAPKLIRITMTLDDPTGRLPDGLTYQYVFSVPAP